MESVQPPDLLHPRPHLRIDSVAVDASLFMAFAGSNTGGLFADALAQAQCSPSSWDPSGFADDLFVASLVRSCFTPSREGRTRPLVATTHLVQTLIRPPAEKATIAFRRAIVKELLDRPELCASLEAVHLAHGRFRVAIEGTSSADRLDPNRRQLDVLARYRDLVLALDRGFASATSGLQRLAEFGRAIREDEAFESLESLLSFDDQLATVSFKVRIGADGRVRALQLLEVEEAEANPFVSSPWQRWKAKLELLARGYRFSDGEVMSRLLDAVYEGIRPSLVPIVQLLGDLEFYLGAMGFADRAAAAGLEVCLPELVEPGDARLLDGLFNPLLLASGVTPVPCRIETDRHDATMLITGPNSGGKTRLLQAVGLSQLMAQSGLFVPAREARMTLASGLLVSLIQQTTVDQSEGRLGTELMRIRFLFERLPPGAMVLLDELCSGTNPSEGEEIFELVLRMLSRLRPQAFITTHFLRFASRLSQDGTIAELRFLQVALDEGHRPTYQFAPGVAETSLAAQAAARLGVTGEQLIALIEAQGA